MAKSSDDVERRRRLPLDLTKLIASAVGSVLAAVVLSKFGVAGTLTGAALGSVVSTVGTELNQHYLSKSSRRLQELRAAQRRSGRAQAGAEPAEEPVEPSAPPAPDRQRPAWMSWKALAALGVGGFLVAMLAITGFELAVGKPLAGLFGNQVGGGRSTTFSEVARGGGDQRERSTTPTPSVDTESTTSTSTSQPSAPTSTGTTLPGTSTTAPGLQQPPGTTAPPSATTRSGG
jgi:uncharacterized protein YcfJ